MCPRHPNLSILFFLGAFCLFVVLFPEVSRAQGGWKEEWEKTLRAADAEGQLIIYGCCYEYDRILEAFKKKYPKIKVTTVLGSGGQLGSRILAERRGEKYLADVFSAGANTIHDVLYHKINALEPIKPALILPEVMDPPNGTRANIATLIPRNNISSLSSRTPSPGKYNITAINR
jgi:hypothetical protein